jgi:hypothetical protein
LPVDREKKPLIKGWTAGTATTDEEQIEKWWCGKFAGRNVGISTGPSNLLVVEVDPRKGGDEAIGRWLREYDTEFVKTVTARSGTGGEQFYFNADGIRFRTTVGEIAPGVDTRAVGGMVVAPSSIHANGRAYRWQPDYSPDDRPLLPVPDFLKHLIPLSRSPRSERRTSLARPVAGAHLNLTRLRRLVADALARGNLAEPDLDDEFALAAQRFLGVPADVELGQSFLCILPGHFERNPSASLGKDSHGRWVYRDHHQRGGCPLYMTLADAYASQRRGWIQKMDGPTLAVWKLAMLAEMGLVDPVAVPLRLLPDDASDDVRRLYGGVRHLLSLKWLYEYGAATPCAWSFMADWTGMDERAVGAAMKELLRMKILSQVSTHRAARGGTMAVFLPVGKAQTGRRKCSK